MARLSGDVICALRLVQRHDVIRGRKHTMARGDGKDPVRKEVSSLARSMVTGAFGPAVIAVIMVYLPPMFMIEGISTPQEM